MNKTDIRNENTIVSPLFQVIGITISSIFFLLIAYAPISEFNSQDVQPLLKTLEPSVSKEIANIQTPVKVGLQIKDFPIFNMTRNEFEVSGVLWFEFDPTQISLATISKFSFEKGYILSMSKPYTQVTGDGKLFAMFDLRLKFTSNLQYNDFPLDSHTLYIVLDNNNVSSYEMRFESSWNEFVVLPNMKTLGWNEIDRQVQVGYSQSRLDNYDETKSFFNPRVVFSIEYLRSGLRYALLIFLPLLLIFYLMLFTFSIDPEKHGSSIISLSTGGITAILAYRFVIENLSPQVGYFMLSDHVFFLFLGGVFVIFLINMLNVKLTILQKKILIVFLEALIIISCYYLFWM